MEYRRDIEQDGNQPVFQISNGTRLSANGIMSVLLRVGKRAGIHITPHGLQRAFATLLLHDMLA